MQLKKSEEESRRPSITSIRMGNGSSSSSSQQQRNEEFADHDYEEIEERDLRRKEKFQRNHSIVTLDIKPGEWERLAEVQRSQQGQTGGRDMWWGEDQQSSRPSQHRESQGGWDFSRAGWRDESSWTTYKRCVSLDVKQIDHDLGEKSEF